jgi:hypothetical protein
MHVVIEGGWTGAPQIAAGAAAKRCAERRSRKQQMRRPPMAAISV